MKSINRFKSFATKAKYIVVALFTASLLGIASAQHYVTAANQVVMEGNTKALNVTAGETEYTDSTNAKVDEVVQVQLWHHNREMPDAGTAKNTTVKFTVPNEQGKKQVITGRTTADNANTIEDTTTVNASLERARVEYMEGTAKFRYNKGASDGDKTCETGMEVAPKRCYETVKISDKVVTEGVNLDHVRGGSLKGCQAFHETVTIQVRVVADVVSVNKYVREIGSGAQGWTTSLEVSPGQEVEYLIRFKNEGNTELKDVIVADNLPKYNAYVEGTTKLQNGIYPNGVAVTSDNVVKGGINTGNYASGASANVWFKVKIDPVQAYERCGEYDIRNVGFAKPRDMNPYYNTAQVIINVKCEEQPKADYKCVDLTGKHVSGRTFKFTVDAVATGNAKIKHYVYSFGDNSEAQVTDKTTVEHTYAKAGEYTADVKVVVEVNGKTQTVTSDECVAKVKIDVDKEVPTKLPETGVSSLAGIFSATTVAGAAAHHIVGRRRG